MYSYLLFTPLIRSACPLCLVQCDYCTTSQAHACNFWYRGLPIRFTTIKLLFTKPSQDIEVITHDGAPSGPKEFLIWTSPHLDPAQPNVGRTNPLTQTTALMRYLMKRGVRTIVFCKVRLS